MIWKISIKFLQIIMVKSVSNSNYIRKNFIFKNQYKKLKLFIF